MGAALGAKLHEAGNTVTLLDANASAVAAINENGLCIEEKDGTYRTVRVPSTTDPRTLPTPELLVVFVKCYHTEAAVKAVLPEIGPNTIVLSLQNGWGNAPRIAAIVGEEKVIVGVTYHSSTVKSIGHILHAGKGPTFIGEVGKPISYCIRTIADILNRADWPTTPSENVLDEIWKKLALNVVTLPTSAISGATAERLLETSEMRELMQGLLREMTLVANAEGISLDYEERWEAITGLLSRLAPGTRGSMLQDVQAKRKTEIDVINGAIVTAGRAVRIPTPYNQSMVALVKTLESTF